MQQVAWLGASRPARATLTMIKLVLALVCASSTASDLSAVRTIGTGLSQARLNATEQVLFEHSLSRANDTGVMNHFWAAGSPAVDGAIVRYYVDGEARASVEFVVAMACGVGFGDQAAPWATKWMGKGANHTGWFHNFAIPFGSSIRITFQHGAGGADAIWLIARGAENLPLRVGALDLPRGARMRLSATSATLAAPLARYDLLSVPAGARGLFFMSTLAVASANQNFMEGCVRMFSPPEQPWPGLLLSTGMEDYYDSAYYFDGGPFHAPVSGVTHLDVRAAEFSGYRFHEMDPIVFSDGVRVEWRNGDATDPATGLKCTLEAGGDVVGAPTASNISSYAWYYTW